MLGTLMLHVWRGNVNAATECLGCAKGIRGQLLSQPNIGGCVSQTELLHHLDRVTPKGALRETNSTRKDCANWIADCNVLLIQSRNRRVTPDTSRDLDQTALQFVQMKKR